MKKANISKIKAELSKYLRFVKQGEIIIVDRDHPIAKIVGIPAESALHLRKPKLDLKLFLQETEREHSIKK